MTIFYLRPTKKLKTEEDTSTSATNYLNEFLGAFRDGKSGGETEQGSEGEPTDVGQNLDTQLSEAVIPSLGVLHI